jgi:hypothetical protein
MRWSGMCWWVLWLTRQWYCMVRGVRAGTFGGRFARPDPRGRGSGGRNISRFGVEGVECIECGCGVCRRSVGRLARLVGRAGVDCKRVHTKQLVYRLVCLQKIQYQRTRTTSVYQARQDHTHILPTWSVRISTNVSGILCCCHALQLPCL